jgi:erythromycin esterase-like protein
LSDCQAVNSEVNGLRKTVQSGLDRFDQGAWMDCQVISLYAWLAAFACGLLLWDCFGILRSLKLS